MKQQQELTFREKIPRFFLLLILLIITALFGGLNKNIFSTMGTTAIIMTTSIQGILALGLMLELTTGNFDLAFGANAGFAAAIVGRIMSSAQPSLYPVVILVGIIAAATVGAISAFLTVKVGIPAFVATLAMRSVLGAFTSLLTNNTTYYSYNWGNTYRILGQGKLFDVIPYAFVIFVIVAVIIYIFTEKSKTGRYIFATGANRTAAQNVGINTVKMQFISFIIGGSLAAIGGIIHSSRNYSVTVQMGLDLQMPALLCCLLSATFLTPGKYNVPGCIVGSMLTAILTIGIFSTLGTSVYIKSIFEGITFMVAIGLIAKISREGLPKVRFDI